VLLLQPEVTLQRCGRTVWVFSLATGIVDAAEDDLNNSNDDKREGEIITAVIAEVGIFKMEMGFICIGLEGSEDPHSP